MAIEMSKMRVRLTFIEDILGTCSGNPEIHREFIASKSPDAATIEDEVAAIGVEGVVEKSMTVFPRDAQGRPFLYDYQIKGFFKDSCGVLKKVPGSKCSNVTAYKKEIDGLLFVFPRKIPFKFSGKIGSCERPLRGQTAQGERIALANSEVVPAGASIEIEIGTMTRNMKNVVKECLEYGTLRGIGQWRNSGKGRFTYEILSDDGKGDSEEEPEEQPKKRATSKPKVEKPSAEEKPKKRGAKAKEAKG